MLWMIADASQIKYLLWYRLDGRATYTQAWQHAVKSTDNPVWFLYFQNIWVTALGSIPSILCSHQVLWKHIQYRNFAESQGKKWCLSSKEEEYMTLHSAYLDIITTWRETSAHASFTLPAKGLQCQAVLTQHCEEISFKDCWWGGRKKRTLYEQWRPALEWKLYTSSCETFPYQNP